VPDLSLAAKDAQMDMTVVAEIQALHWERGRLARNERRQARLSLLVNSHSPASCSRFALAAGEAPALPVKSVFPELMILW
jgi:hypothetical protein